MKKLVVLAIVLAFFAGASYRTIAVHAQSQITLSPGGLLSACKLSLSKELAMCNVSGDSANPDGLYLSANGAGWFGPVSKGGGTGAVSSYNTRTGAVMPVIGDYTFTMIAGALSPSQIPTHTCTMTTVAGSSAAIVTLSNCK